VTRAERQQAAAATTGIWTPLTSFVGRVDDADKLTRLLEDYRLVTVTGPGGVGKTRLATEVARRVGERFPDGVWFVDLRVAADGAQVAAEVMSALGVQQDPGRPPLEVLAEALAPQRLLLILDNCEHVLAAVADLCAILLAGADEVCVLATSREQLGIGGETRYRLAPLELPRSGQPEAVSQSAAVTLFTERARQVDPRFTLSPEDVALVARVVTRLDGIPLAIELAAARVEALGMAGLADRIDDALRLLTGKDQLTEARHRSLAAVADWSYQLLAGPERRVFRRLAAFPGPFTLEAAEAVAGPDAGPIVLRLVDCSLVMPPRPGVDGRTRYTMLQTLRAYGLTRLREAGEEQDAAAALAAFAWSVAEQAAVGLEASDERELDALRWLDAEDATLSRALSWALDHDPDRALRMTAGLAPWLRRRSRLAEASDLLRTAIARSSPANQAWASAHLWLGRMLSSSADLAGALDSYSAAVDAHRTRAPSLSLVQALVGRAVVRLNLGDDPATVHDADRGLEVARELGDPAGEVLALTGLSLTAYYAGDAAKVLDWSGQAQALLPSDIPAHEARWCRYILATVLAETGELDSARRVCADGLALARQADDHVNLVGLLVYMTILERLAGNTAEAMPYLREAAGIALRAGDHVNLTNVIEECAFLCATTERWSDAVTLWAAHAADRKRRGLPSEQVDDDRGRLDYMRRIEQALEPGQLREAQERGARMTVSTAAELAIIVTAEAQQDSPEPAPGKLLSPRERELVTLVAQGHTNAEIAARLYISVRTVASHLDRIRDKTGYRRRADLTRLALEESLV
jgi:predicted ATPase/DNA-binding CsgD family transcriptional regulator